MLFHKMRGIILALMTMLVLGSLSPASATPAQPGRAAATAGELPPEPVKVDRSGSEQDGLIVPSGTGGYYYDENWVDLTLGFNLANGKNPFIVRTEYVGDEGYLVPGPVFTLVFDSSITGSEAPNVYSVVVGKCIDDGGFFSGTYPVALSVLNVDDLTDLAIPVVTVGMKRSDGLSIGGPDYTLANTPYTADLQDAATWDGGTYLSPGNWTVRFYLDGDASASYGRHSFSLKSCAGVDPPVIGGGHHPGIKPSGTLHAKFKAHKVTAKGINRRVQSMTTFKFTRDPKKGKTVTKTFKAQPNKVVTRYFKRAKAGDRFVLIAMIRTNDGVKRVVVDRLRFKLRR